MPCSSVYVTDVAIIRAAACEGLRPQKSDRYRACKGHCGNARWWRWQEQNETWFHCDVPVSLASFFRKPRISLATRKQIKNGWMDGWMEHLSLGLHELLQFSDLSLLMSSNSSDDSRPVGYEHGADVCLTFLHHHSPHWNLWTGHPIQHHFICWMWMILRAFLKSTNSKWAKIHISQDTIAVLIPAPAGGTDVL